MARHPGRPAPLLLGRKNPQAKKQRWESQLYRSGSGRAERTPPDRFEPYTEAYSHPQAFGQTTNFVGKYLRGVGAVDVTSTSKAAELAASDQTGTSAAVAGEIAADMNGLDILARCIEDRDDNTTRFSTGGKF